MIHIVPAVLFGSVGLISFVFAKRFIELKATSQMRELCERMSAARKRYYICYGRTAGLMLMLLAASLILRADWFLPRVFVPFGFVAFGIMSIADTRQIMEDRDRFQRRYFGWLYRPGNPTANAIMLRVFGVIAIVVGLLAMLGVIPTSN